MSSGNGPSAHLTWKELACKDGTPYPQRFINDGRVFKLAQVFEDIRSMMGDYPIIVLSAYRTAEWNRKIGGAKNSQHLYGRALDLKHTKFNIEDFYNSVRLNTKNLGIKGIGRYNTFVHVDIRPSDQLVVWFGAGKKDDSA